MSKLYKGFIETKGKASIEKLKNRTTWKTIHEQGREIIDKSARNQ